MYIKRRRRKMSKGKINFSPRYANLYIIEFTSVIFLERHWKRIGMRRVLVVFLAFQIMHEEIVDLAAALCSIMWNCIRRLFYSRATKRKLKVYIKGNNLKRKEMTGLLQILHIFIYTYKCTHMYHIKQARTFDFFPNRYLNIYI